jgi:phosphoribosylformylglycinamidine synthase
MAAACLALGVPIVSGNVSLYNETNGTAILPTPTIGAVGLVNRPEDVVTSPFRRPGETIVLLGPTGAGLLGGSEYVVSRTGKVQGRLAPIDLEMEGKVQRLALELARGALVSSMHDVSDGGLATALVECCVAVDPPYPMIGADITLPAIAGGAVGALFSEETSRIVASIPPAKLADLRQRAQKAGVPVIELGTTTAADFVVRSAGSEIIRAPLPELRDARERCLVPIVGE